MSSLNHRWDLPRADAVALQKRLAAQVIRDDQVGTVATVAGVDVSIRDDQGRAAVAVLSFPELEIVDYVRATRPVTIPYIPGLLSFREGPVILDAFEKLASMPDLLIFDGQGIAHPRRLGIASHIGLLLDTPSIGCAKSRLCGQHQEPESERGNHVPLIDNGETIGAVVRTRSNVKPVFISIGHRIDLPTSIEYVLACHGGYKLPEPTRWAHRIAGGATPSTA